MREADQAMSPDARSAPPGILTASGAAQAAAGPGVADDQTGSGSRSRVASEQTGSRTGSRPPAPGPLRAGDAEPVGPRILRVAWLAILLGFAIEALLLASAVAFDAYKGPRPFIADLAQQVTWSVIVCVGIAFGTAAGKARPQVMGLFGLAAAPLAFQVARTIHKGMAQALSLAGGGLPFVSVALVGALKSLEYGALGWGIGWIGRRHGTLGAHAGAGPRRRPDVRPRPHPAHLPDPRRPGARAGAPRQGHQRGAVPRRLLAGPLRRRRPRQAPRLSTSVRARGAASRGAGASRVTTGTTGGSARGAGPGREVH